MSKRPNIVHKPKSNPKTGQARYQCTFILGGQANWQLHEMCRVTGKNRSAMVESLILPNFALLFGKFDEGIPFSRVVQETYYSPDVVRQARREYDAGWAEPVPIEIKALDKKLQIKELDMDIALIERTSEERVERLRADTEKRRLDQELRIERTRAVANGGGKR
jgi:hypothetical protein